MNFPSIFLFAGEPSGDQHGEKLLYSLKKTFPDARLFGVGGPKMRSCNFECIIPMEKFQVMGFVDVFFALPRLMRQFFSLRRLLMKEQPDIVLFIDYPGFNLALAHSLFKRSFRGKICQYICPSVWAWGAKRIFKMEKILDCLFVIFPFEKELFDSKKLQVHYVGNPLIGIKSPLPPLNIDPENRVVAIFPGSREKEIYRNFPKHLNVAKKLLAKHSDLYFVISVAQPSFSLILEKILQEQGFTDRDRVLFLEASQNQAIMKRCTMALAKSGTNNLELALHKVPTIVTYGIRPLDLFIAKNILKIRLPFYCIVNIIGGRSIYPELIGPQFTEETLFTHADRFLSSDEILQECREKCHQIDTLLECKIPEQEIAREIKKLLDEK